MKTRWLLILGLMSLISATPGIPKARAAGAEASGRNVFIVPIREEIGPQLVYIVRRGVKEAMDAKADLLILDMETDGGRISTTEDIIQILGNFKGTTVTYVNKRAFSAGSFIAVATQKIYMAPQSVIGAAAPVMMAADGSGIQDIPGTAGIKIKSGVRALVRGTAEKNGYNTDVVEAMIDTNKEVIIDGHTINKSGDILTLTDTEAAKKYGKPPKPLLSSGTVDSMDGLLKELGYANAQVTRVEPTGAEKIGAWINAISPLLLIVGIAGIYIEIKFPGLVIPAVVAVVAFLLYFLGGYIAGLSGMGWIVIFVIGLALLISELFVHPGTVLPGVLGLILIMVSLVMSMVDVYPGMPAMPSLPQLKLPLENIAIAFMGSVVIIAILARVLPRTSIYRSLVSQSASGVTSVMEQQQEQASRVGQTGVAISNLRPGGKAQFGEQILDVITQGELIAKGQSVRIIRHSGTEAVVEIAA